MKIRCVAKTNAFNSDCNSPEVFSGIMAGICYMKDDYDTLAANSTSALKRFEGTVSSGHHSVGEHYSYTLVFEGASKAFAMLLNGTQVYATSEKSGRYTVMSADNILYNKWRDIFIELLGDEKLANENARMILSVFHKGTTFAFTATLTRWNYIMNWCDRFIENSKGSKFCSKLVEEVDELRKYIAGVMNVGITDSKDLCFDVFLNGVPKTNHIASLSAIKPGFCKAGLSYTVAYEMSFVAAAQAERHRTTRYHMIVPEEGEKYYTPECLRGTAYEKQWIEDLKTVEYPQALMITVIEQSTLDRFILKCKERLCGAAQPEVREATLKVLSLLTHSANKVDQINDAYGDIVILNTPDNVERNIMRNMLKEVIGEDGVPKLKCEMVTAKCSRPCGKAKELKESFKLF